MTVGALDNADLLLKGNSAALDSCQPDAVPGHRPRDLNGSQVGGLGLRVQVGGQADFQLKTEQSGLNQKSNL